MKKIIKKFLVIFIILLYPFILKTNYVFGINFEKIKKNIIVLHEKKGDTFTRNLIKQIEKIESKKSLKKQEKEILKKLKEIILEVLETKKIKQKKSIVKKNTNNVNEKINNFRKNFYNKYAKNIISKNKISKLCLEKYNLIDSIAKKNDFPTELIIATWGMEHSCIFDNPKNGWGNFQITSKYYKPGKITDKQFATQIQDFINFSKNKWKFYERYKKFKPGTIKLKYNNYDFPSIRYHAIAYNGVINDYYTSKYLNGNLNSLVRYKKDGITTRFLKILKWEIDNKKTGNSFGYNSKEPKNFELKDEKKIIRPKKEFDSLSIKKIKKDNYKIFGKTNGKLKYIEVLWLNGPKNEKPYRLKSYNFGGINFFYTIKPEYENIKNGLNKYKFFGENIYGKKFEKIIEIKN